jgi:hypothetical protein
MDAHALAQGDFALDEMTPCEGIFRLYQPQFGEILSAALYED